MRGAAMADCLVRRLKPAALAIARIVDFSASHGRGHEPLASRRVSVHRRFAAQWRGIQLRRLQHPHAGHGPARLLACVVLHWRCWRSQAGSQALSVMHLLIPAPPQITLGVAGESARFPVNRVFCVGRNYAAHAREMGLCDREPPFFFMKPASAVVDASRDAQIAYPPQTRDFHHEVELVAAIGQGGRDLSPEQAPGLVFGYAVGLDMTRRDLQQQARQKSHPWEFAKAFSGSAPVGALVRWAKFIRPVSR